MLISKTPGLRLPRAVAALLLVASAAFAQVGDAEISGVVTDPSGAPVAAAKLSLTNEDSGVNWTALADNEGRYRFPALAPGRYSLKTEAPGFRSASITGRLIASEVLPTLPSLDEEEEGAASGETTSSASGGHAD